MYTVFSQPVLKLYQVSLCSKATVFYIAATILTFVPPLLIAFRSQGFWQKIDTYQEQPDVHFQHELVILIEASDPDKSFGWSTMANLNQLLGERLATPSIKSRETDWNRDGKLDYIDLEIEIATEEPVYGVQVYLLFDVRLYKYSSVKMQGLVFNSASTGLPSNGISINGDLSIAQKQPLASKGQDRRFESPIFNGTSIFAEAFDFEQLIQDYSQRNLSTRLTNDYVMWQRGVGGQFSMKYHINYPEQTLSYYTGIWQMLKWAWVQYLAILVIFIAVFREVKMFVFGRQVLPSSLLVQK